MTLHKTKKMFFLLITLVAAVLLMGLVSACLAIQPPSEKENLPPSVLSSSQEPASSEADLQVSSPESPVVRNPEPDASQPLPPPDPLEDDWQTLFDRATAMEAYLRSVLSPQDYGGMNVFTGTLGETLEETVKDTDAGKPRLLIWALNIEPVNAAIQAYSGDKADVAFQSARWSLEDMERFANALKNIPLKAGENMLVHLSEQSNKVIANISKTGADRLTAEINSLLQVHSIPNDCVLIWTMGVTEESFASLIPTIVIAPNRFTHTWQW